jgi:hypothetical protein
MWSIATADWTLKARFNNFASNNAGMHILTGAYSAHTELGGGRTFKVPATASVVEYNRFTANTKFSLALCDLGKDSGT